MNLPISLQQQVDKVFIETWESMQGAAGNIGEYKKRLKAGMRKIDRLFEGHDVIAPVLNENEFKQLEFDVTHPTIV